MRTTVRLVIIILIETIFFWFFFNDVEPSVSIGLILLVPAVFFVNLIASAIFYFGLKKRDSWFIVFLINSIVCSVVLYYIFSTGVENHQRKTMSSWNFKNGDTTYSIIIWKKTNEYDITYSTEPGLSMSYLSGSYQQKDGELLLKSSSKNYVVRNNYLLGFGSKNDSIKLVANVQ